MFKNMDEVKVKQWVRQLLAMTPGKDDDLMKWAKDDGRPSKSRWPTTIPQTLSLLASYVVSAPTHRPTHTPIPKEDKPNSKGKRKVPSEPDGDKPNKKGKRKARGELCDTIPAGRRLPAGPEHVPGARCPRTPLEGHVRHG